MHLLSIVVHTANILGIFTDPFEFEGDYGPEINPIRQKVFELVVSKEALASREKKEAAKEQDRQYGPTLEEVVTPEMLQMLAQKQVEIASFSRSDLEGIFHFVEQNKDVKIFYFLRHMPSDLLHLDKKLRDQASLEGKPFGLPLLSSTEPLIGTNSLELKLHLLDAVLTPKTFLLTKPKAPSKDYEALRTPGGQVFTYWLYHAFNLHLVSQDPSFIAEINRVKENFAKGLGDPEVRASQFLKKLRAANSGVVFTQESDTFVPQALVQGGYLPIDKQNPKGGLFIFLHSNLWEKDYEIVPVEGYESYVEGNMTLILATLKETQEKFLLVSGHGNSTKPEDGRLQISLAKQTFDRLKLKHEGLQLVIGIDANTKSEKDIHDLRAHLDQLGLVATSVGPTTIKRRMVTTQHAKAGREARDEEDFIITLKPEKGGRYALIRSTVGFREEKPDYKKMLPNVDNPSDHYPVGATLSSY